MYPCGGFWQPPPPRGGHLPRELARLRWHAHAAHDLAHALTRVRIARALAHLTRYCTYSHRVLARVHCQAQLRVLGMLYIGCETIWYHSLDGEQSRTRILHVQVMTMPKSSNITDDYSPAYTELVRATIAHAYGLGGHVMCVPCA